MNLLDFGNAIVETKQLAPGTRPDSLIQFGIKVGSAEDILDIAPVIRAREPQLDVDTGECATASE